MSYEKATEKMLIGKRGKPIKGNYLGIVRNDVYGPGFLSLPQEEQYKRIDNAFLFERPHTVVHQMSFLVATQSKHPTYLEQAYNDLHYATIKAESIDKTAIQRNSNRCPTGYKRQLGYFVGKRWIEPYCIRK